MIRDQLMQACPALGVALCAEPSLESVLDELIEHGLTGALTTYLADGSPQAVQTLLQEASRLDMKRIALHREALQRGQADPLGVEDVEAVPLVTLEEQAGRAAKDGAAGLEALECGQVATLAFAGGSGTRFFSRLDQLDQALTRPNERLRAGGFDPADPKGMFPISPVAGLSFYELIFAEALAAGVRVGRLPWVLLLTSTVTHDRTVAHLTAKDLWGFPQSGWLAFKQADEPRLDAEEQLVVVDDQGHLAWTGDGHGGVYRALMARTGEDPSVLDRIQADGVTQLVMHNVDNAAARPFAPERLGFHLRQGSYFTLSATRKTDPNEKVGLLMRIRETGKLEVIEYNVIDPAIAAQCDPDTGRLVHEAGNSNSNLVAVEAIRADIEPTLYQGKQINSRKGPVETSSLEMLNQHLTRLLSPDRVRAYEVDRNDFFMPTKNVTGVDSVESTVKMMSARFSGLLQQAGAQVAESALVDLHPACCRPVPELIARGIGPGWTLSEHSRLYLNAGCGLEPGSPPMAEGLDLERGASLLIHCARPFGELTLGPDRRLQIREDGRSRLVCGRDVRLAAGVRVSLEIGPGATLEISEGRVFDRDLELCLGPDESQIL